ncbi:MAG: hypothetical protein U0Z70_03850 [Thermomicrobiales bacterium]
MKSDARRAQRSRTLGPNAACVLCGYRNPEALLQRPCALLEAHHVCARANDPELTVILCRNCHAEVTERQRIAGVSFGTPATLLHQLLAALVSLAVFLLDLGQRMQTWTVALQAFLVRLDQELPTWRTWPEAQPWGGAA